MAPVFNVAVLIYEGADILDYSGPLEIYTTNPPPDTPASFKTTTFAYQNPTQVARQALTIVPDKSIQEIDANLEDYDILLVPGAGFDTIRHILTPSDEGKAIVALIKKFATLPPRKETGHRILESVCSGAVLLADAGLLANRTVTTHHLCYDILKEYADKTAGGDSKVNVVRKRWVDAGTTDAGVGIINAGGVTSGIDATLYIVETLVSKKSAAWAADIVEFERRAQDAGWGS